MSECLASAEPRDAHEAPRFLPHHSHYRLVVSTSATAESSDGGELEEAKISRCALPALTAAEEVPPLRPDQVAEIEEELLKVGGSERFRRLSLHLGVQERQVQVYFRLYEDQGKLFISHLIPERERLESMLFNLQPTRAAVAEAMAFCMQNAAVHGAMLAQVLVASLTLPGLASAMVLARLFLISDVLFNSKCSAKGAARYRSQFEELLPDAFEKMGQWLPGQDTAEAAARSMLDAWRKWDVFPSVFLDGLESLLLSPVPSSLEACLATEAEGLPLLRQKMEQWASAEHCSPTEARQGARCRGLAGAKLPVARCRLRLCHCERYWHGRVQVQEEATEEAPPSAELMDVDDARSIDGDPADGEEVPPALSWPVLGLTEWPLGIGMDPGALPDMFEPVYVLNCTPPRSDGGVANVYEKDPKFEYCRVSLGDNATETLQSRFEASWVFLEKARIREDGAVLIHCQQGVSRSVSMAMSYMMKYYRIWALHLLQVCWIGSCPCVTLWYHLLH
ncbi:RRC1 [Symbiodinium pilosum]|uniref:RRC1 protein n=1 Tax=Symbiodinium pilosum TaxID=2952 RepID=A0A812W9V8_SYMPI|nr:RRC1 [Symbiodinium pilosum]